MAKLEGDLDAAVAKLDGNLDRAVVELKGEDRQRNHPG